VDYFDIDIASKQFWTADLFSFSLLVIWTFAMDWTGRKHGREHWFKVWLWLWLWGQTVRQSCIYDSLPTRGVGNVSMAIYGVASCGSGVRIL